MRARSAVTSGAIVSGWVRAGTERRPPAADITSCQTVTPWGTPASDSSVEAVMPRLRSNRPVGAAGSATTRRTRKETGPDDVGALHRRTTAPFSCVAVRLDGGASASAGMPAGASAGSSGAAWEPRVVGATSGVVLPGALPKA